MNNKKITLIFCLAIFLSAERGANAQTSVTYNYVTNAAQTFIVPSCVTGITVQMWGAGGGSGNMYGPNDNYGYKAGASGAYYEATITGLNAGEVLNLYVPSGGTVLDNDNEDYDYNGFAAGGWPGGGQGGWGGWDYSYGGGGGGYAGISINGTYYVVAGGGGGGGGYCCDNGNYGGGGGDSNGGVNPGWGYEYFCCAYHPLGYTASGGSCSAGGAAPTYSAYGYPGTSGALLTGGNGCGQVIGGDYYGGGGGGAGYYGGGGGGDYYGEYGMGGGGGSSFPCISTFTSAGITTTRIYNIAGTEGDNPNNYAAPGGAPVTIGFGGYDVTGGNGEIIIMYVTDSVGPNSAMTNLIDSIRCNGENTGAASVLVNGMPGGSSFTYTWLPSGGTGDTISAVTAGTYTVMVNAGSCGSASATVTISQPAFFASNPTISYPLCNGGTGSIIGDAVGGTTPYTFAFTPGGNVPAIYGLTAGSYSLNILDNRGCATSELITLTEPTAILASASMLSAPNCYGGSGATAVASVTGGTYPYAYAWSPSGGSNLTASNLMAGNYFITVTDANGCTETASVTVSQPGQLNAIVNPPLLNLACNGDNNGVLGSGVSGGIRPYNYNWSGGLGSDTDLMNLSAGTYYLTVRDAHGCVTTDSAMVVQPPAMNLAIQTTLDAGNCSAAAWVVLSGGTPGYRYLWSNGSMSFYQSDLCAGESYCCLITDSNNCKYNICTDIESDLGVGNISTGDNKIKVYPNPNNGQFTVVSSVSGEQWTVEIYNVLGEKVCTQTSNGDNQMTINMSSHANGIYLYRVISNENGSLLGTGKVDIEK